MRIFGMSDIHGCWGAFEEALSVVPLDDPATRLVLLGDHIDHAYERPETYTRLRLLQESHPGRVTCLMGNCDDAYLLERGWEMPEADRKWLESLPAWWEAKGQVWVHAGVREELGREWRAGTEDWYAFSKFPPSTGPFVKDVVAGHVPTFRFCGEARAWWDGASHYYVDGSTESTGTVPVICYDTGTGLYTTFERSGSHWDEVPVRGGRKGKGRH